MTGKAIDMAESRGAPGSMVLLTRLAKQVYRRANEEQLGMQMRHLVALTFLRDHQACPQQELGDAFCMDAHNVVLLTAAGRSALESAERAQETVEDDVLRALDDEDRKILWQLLTRALRGVEPADGPPVAAGGATDATQ